MKKEKVLIVVNILIICFVLFTVYLVRDDIVTAYHRVADLISGKKESISVNADPAVNTIVDSRGFEKIINTPGPLRLPKLSIIPKQKNGTLDISAIIIATNDARKENGNLVPLLENPMLDASAKMKLDDMFKKQYFAHVSPDGTKLSDLSKTVGYDYILIGENLALGDFTSSQDVVDAWMASPGHRANILNIGYHEIGIAVEKGIYEGKETWIAVQHFGLPLSVCPTLDTTLKQVITDNQQKLDTTKAELDAERALIDANDSSIPKKEYNQRVEAYNAAIVQYNALAVQTKQDIDTYNNQVRTFNTCIAQYVAN